MSHLIDNCPKIKNISIDSCNDLQGINPFISQKFNQLEMFHLMYNDFVVDEFAIARAIVSNRKLISLRIGTESTTLNTSHLIRLIGENLLKLEELIFDFSIDNLDNFQNDIEYIGQVHLLSELGLNLNGLDVKPLAKVLAKNNLPIKNLSIENGNFDDDAIKWISKLKLIETISLISIETLNEEHLIDLARNLTALKKMTLCETSVTFSIAGLEEILRRAENLNDLEFLEMADEIDCTINTDDYEEMVKIMKDRPVKQHLHILIEGKQIKINVPEKILKQHRDVLLIECC